MTDKPASRPSDASIAFASMREHIARNLPACCAELLKWQETSLLENGRIREAAKLVVAHVGEDSLRVAERETERQATRLASQLDAEREQAPPAATAQTVELVRSLRREIKYLRHYGNKDCTAMADEAMREGTIDDNLATPQPPSVSEEDVAYEAAAALAALDGYDVDDRDCGLWEVQLGGTPPEPVGSVWDLDYLPKGQAIASALAAKIAAWNTRVSPQAGSVPGGFVLVPKVPTPEMQRAGIAHVLRLNEEENDPGSDEHYRASGCLYAVWMDMLAAAPAPQRKEGEL